MKIINILLLNHLHDLIEGKIKKAKILHFYEKIILFK